MGSARGQPQLKLLGAAAAAGSLLLTEPSEACSIITGPMLVSYELPVDGVLSVRIHCYESDCVSASDVVIRVLDASEKEIPGTRTEHALPRGGPLIAWLPSVALAVGDVLKVVVNGDVYDDVSVVPALGETSPFGDRLALEVSEGTDHLGDKLCCSPDLGDSCGPSEACFYAEKQTDWSLVVDWEWGHTSNRWVLDQFLYRLRVTRGPEANDPPFRDWGNASWLNFAEPADEYCATYEALRLTDGQITSGEETCVAQADLPAPNRRSATLADAEEFLESYGCDSLPNDANELLCEVGAEECSSCACRTPGRGSRRSPEGAALLAVVVGWGLARRRR